MFGNFEFDYVFYIFMYTFGAYIVSYIGKFSMMLNRRSNKNYIISEQSVTAYRIAIALSWIVVGFFILMSIKAAFTPDKESDKNSK